MYRSYSSSDDDLLYISKLTVSGKTTTTDDFNFTFVNFPFICNNSPAVPAYGVYIYLLIRYSRSYGSYQDFTDRVMLLTRKLLDQGFILVKLKSSLRKLYASRHDLVNRYGTYVLQVPTDIFHLL